MPRTPFFVLLVVAIDTWAVPCDCGANVSMSRNTTSVQEGMLCAAEICIISGVTSKSYKFTNASWVF